MEFPLVLGLYFGDPQLVVACRVVAAVLAFAIRRPPLQKVFFNCALFAFETAGAVAIWHAVVGEGEALGPRGWLATGLAVTFTSVMGAVLVAVVITVASGVRPPLRESFSPRKAGEYASACFALVAVYVTARDVRAAWLLGVVLAVLWVAHRSYDGVRLRSESLEQVNRFTESVGREVELEAVIAEVLRGVCAAFPAQRAELRLVHVDGSSWDWCLEAEAVERRTAHLLAALADAVTEASLLGPKHSGSRQLATLGLRDGLFVPLRSEGRVVGSLALANMVGDFVSFGAEQLRQLQALANHAAVAIDNALRADLI